MTKKLSAKEQLKKEEAAAKRRKHQDAFRIQLRGNKISDFVEEYKFDPNRNFKFDFAFVGPRIAVELDGGIHMEKGGHNTGTAILRDRRKDQAALLLDWTVFRVAPEMIKSGEAVQTLIILINNRKKD